MNYTVHYGGNIFKTACPINQAMTGGLATIISNTEISCPENLDIIQSRNKCQSIMDKTTHQCTSIDYHIMDKVFNRLNNWIDNTGYKIDKNDDAMKRLVNALAIVQNICTNVPKTNSINDIFVKPTSIYYKNMKEFWSELEYFIGQCEKEISLRNNHRTLCVCLSDISHSDRLRNLHLCTTSFLRIKIALGSHISTHYLQNVRNNDLLYNCFKFILLKDQSAKTQIKTYFIDEIKNYTPNVVNINQDGRVNLNDTYFNDYRKVQKYLNEPVIENYINLKVLECIQSLLLKFETYHPQVSNVSCIMINPTSNTIEKVGFNIDDISTYIKTNYQYDIDPEYIESVIQANRKLMYYTSCFLGTKAYNTNKMNMLCSSLSQIPGITEDILTLANSICNTVSGGGDGSLLIQNSNQLVLNDIDSTEMIIDELKNKMKPLLPIMDFFNIIGRNRRDLYIDPTYVPTGDINIDIVHMTDEARVIILNDIRLYLSRKVPGNEEIVYVTKSSKKRQRESEM